YRPSSTFKNAETGVSRSEKISRVTGTRRSPRARRRNSSRLGRYTVSPRRSAEGQTRTPNPKAKLPAANGFRAHSQFTCAKRGGSNQAADEWVVEPAADLLGSPCRSSAARSASTPLLSSRGSMAEHETEKPGPPTWIENLTASAACRQ